MNIKCYNEARVLRLLSIDKQATDFDYSIEFENLLAKFHIHSFQPQHSKFSGRSRRPLRYLTTNVDFDSYIGQYNIVATLREKFDLVVKPTYKEYPR